MNDQAKTPVTATHWAARDRENFAEFCKLLPPVLETDFALWQMRVDRPGDTPHQPLARLQIATTYEMHQGRPTGREFRFMVLAETHRDAFAKVTAQLTAHGLNPENWQTCLQSSLYILA